MLIEGKLQKGHEKQKVIKIVQFQKIICPYFLYRTTGIGTSQGGGISGGRKYLNRCMELDWNFQKGGGEAGIRKKTTFCEGGMAIFWN